MIPATTFHRAAGFSLIEIMVALGLGVLISIGVVSLFGATSKANKVQTQLARLQENGRYAITRIVGDLEMANTQYCSNSGGVPQHTSSTALYIDGVRAPLIYAKPENFTLPDQTAAAATAPPAGQPLTMLSRFFMRGYECNGTSCTPDPSKVFGGMSTTTGNRAPFGDVLTMRYLSGKGWPLARTQTTATGDIAPVPSEGTIGCSSSGDLTSVYIRTPNTALGERPLSDFNAANDLAMLADCSVSQVFAAAVAGTQFKPDASKHYAGATPKCVTVSTDARLFDFTKDFTTVSYYLEIQDDANPAMKGRKWSALKRRINGGPGAGGMEEVIAQGVERLDFRYAIEDASGNTAYLTADEVDKADTASGGSMTCPPLPPGMTGDNAKGCMWRAVKSIEVSMLLDSVDDVQMSANEMAFAYSADAASLPATPKPPAAGDKQKSGLPLGKMLRREFTAVVALRNYLN